MVASCNGTMDFCSLSERQILSDFIQAQMQEISRLKEENEVLKQKVATLEKTATSTLSQQSRLKFDLENAQKSSSKSSSVKDDTSDDVSMLSDRISSLSSDLREAEANYNQKFSSLDEELTNAKHYILNLQHELETLHGEFDKKFSETTQFKNLKKMLEGKNTQLKEIRNRIKKYEPDFEL